MIDETVDIQEPEKVEQQPTQQDPPTKKLYDGLVSKGLYTKTFDDFQKQFSNEESINKLHKGLQEQGLYSKGDTDFYNQFFPTVKKKEQPSSNGLSDFGLLAAPTQKSSSPFAVNAPTEQQGFKKVDNFSSRRLRKDTPAYDAKVKEVQDKSFVAPHFKPTLNEAEDIAHTQLGGKIADPEISDKLKEKIVSERDNPAVQYELGKTYLGTLGLKEGEDVANFYQTKKAELEKTKDDLENEYDKYYSNVTGGGATEMIGKQKSDQLKAYENKIGELDDQLKTFNKYAGVLNAKKSIDETPLPTDEKDIPNYFQTLGAKVNSLSNPDAIKNHVEDNSKDNFGVAQDNVDVKNYDNEMTGIIAKQNDLLRKVKAGEISQEDYTTQSKDLEGYANTALDRHTGAKIKVYGKALGEIIDDNRKGDNVVKSAWNNIFTSAPSKEETQKAIDKLKENGATFTPKEEKYFLDNPSEIQGTAVIPTYVFKTADGFSKMLNPVERLVGGATQEQQDVRQETFDKNIAVNPNKQFEQPATILDTKKGDTFLKDIENPNAGDLNWGYGTAQGTAGAMATITNYIIGNKGFGALSKAAGLGKAGTTLASNVATNIALTHDDAIKTAETFTKNKNEQEAYALITGALGGLLFAKLDPEGIVKKAFTNPTKETIQDFLTVARKEGVKAMDKESVGKFIGNTIQKAVANNASASALLTTNEFKDVVVESLFNPKTASKHDFNIGKTLLHNAITFGALSLLHGAGAAKGEVAERDAIRQSAFEASKDIPAFKNDLDAAVSSGKITEQDAAEKLDYVSKLAEVRNSKDIPQDLSIKNQARYATNLAEEKQIQENTDGVTDKVQLDKAKEKIDELQTERKQLIENPEEPKVKVSEDIIDKPTEQKGEPENISQPIELSVEGKDKFPLPKKPVEDMTSAELDKHIEEVKDYHKKTKLTKEQEDNLTQEQADEYYGKNLPKEGVYDPTELQRIRNRVSLIEEAENINDIAATVKRPLIDYARKQDTENLAVIKAAKRQADKLGIPTDEFVNSIKEQLKSEFKGDANAMTKVVLDAIQTKTNVNEEAKTEKPTTEAAIGVTEGNEHKPTEETGNTKENVGEHTPPPNEPSEEVDNEDNSQKGGISKKALKKEYGFVKDFPSVTDQEVANNAMDKLHASAESNGVSLEQQAANEVAMMKNKKGEASEHDIMVAAYHLRNLDEQIAKANKNNTDAEHLLNQREEALTTLRQLGNNAGRNLRLFGNVYKKVEGGRLEVVRAELKRDLGVDDIPKSMLDLKLSKLSDADKKKVEPYVKAIEELNKTINDINNKADKSTTDINSKEVQDYIEAEVAKRLKEQKGTSPKAREKKSQLFKDIAQRIRTANELDKFAKSAGGEIQKSSIFGDVDFKELAAQAMEYLAKGVEKGEDIAELIKKASIKFRGKFDASEFGKALNTIVSKSSLPDKDEVISKIKEIAKNESATGITPDMVKHGLINDVVNDYIHSDTPTNSVIKEATKELQKHLPDVTEEQVQDAILKRGEFKPKTKQQLKTEITEKATEVKKLASTQNDTRELGNGVRKETGNKSEINIAKAAQDFIDEIKNDDTLTDEVKKEHIKAVEAQRDAELANTHQGVLVNLKDAIDNHIADLTTKQNDAIVANDKETANKINEVKKDLQNLSKVLSPNPEKLKDQIDKADQDLNAIIKSNEGTEFAKDLKDIQKEFHDNWQKTADELEQQKLLNSAKQGLKEAERRLLAGQYTSIPTTPYEAKKDSILALKEAETKRAWNKLNSLSIKAKEQRDKKGIINKWLNTRRDIMIMSFGAIEKVAGSSVTKPFLDPLIKQTAGRLSALITGIKPTKLSRLGGTYRQLKNEASANEFMKKANNNYVDAIVNHDKTVKQFGEDSEQAKASFKKLQEAEINHLAALPYLFINAGSHIDIAQVITKGATDFDANIGKYQQSLAKERTKWEGTRFWLQSVNRTHAAMKSVSHRQALIDHYIENLQYAQAKDGSVSNEARQHAWDVATLSAEEGRFGEKTLLSDVIAKGKNSKSNWIKYPTKFLAPVAKISINITKQGIDMAFPFVEATARTLGSSAFKGIELNKADGVEFSNFASKYYNGVKRSFNDLPLQQKKYINTLIARGLFGLAQYTLVGYALANGGMKFGGSYDSNDPYHKKKVLGSDGQPLDYDEWEIGGQRLPKILNVIINHSPYSLPASLAAVTHDQLVSDDKKGMQIFHAFTKTANEVYHRLPFSTAIDFGKAIFGDQYKLQNVVANEVPTMKATAEYLDKTKDGEVRPVDTKGTGFWNTTGKIIESKIPFLRNTLPTKGTTYTDEELKTFKPFLDKNVNLPDLSPDKIETKKINNKVVEHLSDYDAATQKLYVDKHKQYFKNELDDLKSGKIKIYVDKDGTATTPTKDFEGKKEISFDKLTKEQLQNVISGSGGISTEVTEKVKKEVLKNKRPVKK